MAIGRERQRGAQIAVAAGVALLATCLAGTPLYVSSSATAAVQQQLAVACPGDAGLSLQPSNSSMLDALVADAGRVAHVDPPVQTRSTAATYTVDTPQGPSKRVLNVVSRTGQDRAVSPALAKLDVGDLAVPSGRLQGAGLSVGQALAVTPRVTFVVVNGTPLGQDRAPVDVRIATAYDDIGYEPEPAFWCDLRGLLRPNAQGDPPPPFVLASATTVEVLDPSGLIGIDVHIDAHELTRHDAGEVEHAFAAMRDHLRKLEDAAGITRRPKSDDGLPTILRRADALAAAVGRTIAPVRLAGVLAATLLLVAAAVMVARERRRELRLAALRGAGPWATVRWLAPGAVLAGAVGLVVGAAIAFGAVRLLGPAPQFEADVVRRATLAAVVGAVAAVCLVVAIAATTGNRFVDAVPRRRWWRWIPIELVVVALAVVSYRRIRSVGGVRMFGVNSSGGDLLAQAFPLLGLVAIVAVLVRPLRWLASRARTSGRRLPRAVRLGWRRAIGDPVQAVALVTAVALASGCAVLAVVLSRTAERELQDKARLYVGSDLTVRVDQPGIVPATLADRATVITRHPGHAGSEDFEVLGVDPATFGRVAWWRDDASSRPLTDLLGLLGPARPDGSLPAIVVRSTPDTTVVDQDVVTVEGAAETAQQRMTVHPVATAAFFPGYHSGTTLLVVDRAALVPLKLASTDSVLVRDPPSDAVALIRAANHAVRSVQPADDVFDAVTFAAERWAYNAVGGFAALVAAVAIVMQLLVVESRRDSRRLSDVVLRRTGFGARATWTAALVEVGVPVGLGVGIGIVTGRIVAGMAVTHLDPLRSLRPPADLVLPMLGVLATVAVGMAVIVLLAAASVVSTRRADTMEVVRGTA